MLTNSPKSSMIYFKKCISRLFNTWRGEVMRVYLHWLQNSCYTVCNSRQQDQWQGRDSSMYSLSAMVQSFGILKGGTKDHIISLQVMVNESRCKRAWHLIILNRLEFNSPQAVLFKIWLNWPYFAFFIQEIDVVCRALSRALTLLNSSLGVIDKTRLIDN